jgi:hypothetical protein
MSVWPQYVMLAYFIQRVLFGVYNSAQESSPARALGYVGASASYIYILYVGNFFASLGWPA